MRTSAKLIILGMSTASLVANAGDPCRIVDNNGNYIVSSQGHRIKSSLETHNVTISGGGNLLDSSGNSIIALTFT